MSASWKPRRSWREFPYYKLQIFSEVTSAWADVPGAFDSVLAARTYQAEKLGGKQSRIVVVEDRRKRHVLEGE